MYDCTDNDVVVCNSVPVCMALVDSHTAPPASADNLVLAQLHGGCALSAAVCAVPVCQGAVHCVDQLLTTGASLHQQQVHCEAVLQL
jgi:hypothetical protein